MLARRHWRRTAFAIAALLFVAFAVLRGVQVYCSAPVHLTMSGGEACPMRSQMARSICGEVRSAGIELESVKNTTSENRIVEYDGQLIQKIYPIYIKEQKPVHWLDYTVNLYQPTKYFAGITFDTYHFNILVIWAMTVLLSVTLYFDLLRKLVYMFENRRRYHRKDKP